MRNYKSSFNRTGEISREPRNRSDWLEDFAEKLAVEEQANKKLEQEPEYKKASKNAVEVARERQYQPSIYEMMSAIVSGQKPKFSSVEEAVKDYQQRTGLAQYLKAKSNEKIADLAFEIVQAAQEESEEECETEKVCEEDACLVEDYAHEDDNCLAEGCESVDEKDDGMTFSLGSLFSELLSGAESKKKSSIAGDEERVDTPAVILENPAIEHFITNMIDTNYGIQVPALIHSLVETFGRDGITQQIIYDKDLLNWINQKLIQARKIVQDTPSHIGRGVGVQVDYSGANDSNKDPFTLLVPNNGS